MFEQAAPLLQVPGGPELLIVGVILVIFLVFTAIWVGLAYWVYRDASRRNMDNPILWAAITFFIGLIGLVIYLVVRE